MIQFKPATNTDISLIHQLAHTIWHSHYPGIISVEQIEYMLNLMYSANVISKEISTGYNWELIYEGIQPIGFLSFLIDEKERSVKLNKLYILSSFHGKGYGNQSLNYLKEKCVSLKLKKLHLVVNKKNTKAIQAYLKAGFYKEKEVVTEIGNGFVMDDFVMAINL
jgi:RimJ/RimL family protein N-acetyltransferase